MKDLTATGCLNYHHLRHFWIIAREGNMTRAAEKLKVSQSTLSEQLGELETSLGERLFDRVGRRLQLTEAGRISLDHAERIFREGQDLVTRIRQKNENEVLNLRIGAVGPLSKNLQFDFIEPLVRRSHAKVQVAAGSLKELVAELHDHKLDLVLSNIPLRGDENPHVFNHVLGEMPVYLAGSPPMRPLRGSMPGNLAGVPLFLPSRESHVRADFEALLDRARVEPDIRAEVDDMALLRLLALSGHGFALVPAIVVERELRQGGLQYLYRVPRLKERFYAISLKRRLGMQWAEQVVAQFRGRIKELVTWAGK